MQIILVPFGSTSEYQPLERKVHVVVKNVYSSQWLRYYTLNQQYQVKERDYAEQFINAFNSVSKQTTLKA